MYPPTIPLRHFDSHRLRAMRDVFRASFGDLACTRLVRAPGRVNLIGDHTDYNGLPVFPMAIQRDMAVLFRSRRDAQVMLYNTDDRFPPREFGLSHEITPGAQGDWGNYLKAAGQSLVGAFGALGGIEGVVSGNVPVASGLSSSSALVVACGLAIVAANQVATNATELAVLFAAGERYVGAEIGGMDQAISLGGRRDTAFRIDFHPLRLVPTPIPAGWRFIVASSLVEAPKSASARDVYNARTRECRQALTQMRTSPRISSAVSSYPSLLEALPIGEILAIAETSLSETLLMRMRHTVTEATRVEDAREAMMRDDPVTFGGLMTSSHRSLREDYEVSCPQLDEIVDICLDAGSFGSRLTGAGLGGCAVALCDEQNVEPVLDLLRERYYARRRIAGPIGDHLLVAEPSDGASLVDLAS